VLIEYYRIEWPTIYHESQYEIIYNVYASMRSPTPSAALIYCLLHPYIHMSGKNVVFVIVNITKRVVRHMVYE